jgi:hypothetical protein
MPRGNGTGPMGAGPKTGRGMGKCAGFATSGYAKSELKETEGFGHGQCHGFGRRNGNGGFRNRFNATGIPGWMRSLLHNEEAAIDPDTKKTMLVRQSEQLQQQLDLVKKRIDEMDSAE